MLELNHGCSGFPGDSIAPRACVQKVSFWSIGIDPGIRGAIAAISEDMSSSRILKMPMLEKSVDVHAIKEFFNALRSEAPIRHALIEKSQVMPRQGAVSGFVYGRNYGVLVACLELLGIPFVETPPARWKIAIIGPSAKPPSDASDPARKKAVKELAIMTARRMFPGAGPFKKTEDGPAEAILLAEASRRLSLHGSMSMTSPAAK